MRDNDYRVRVSIELIDYENRWSDTVCAFDDTVRVRDVDSDAAEHYFYLKEGKNVGGHPLLCIVDIDTDDIMGLVEYIKLRLENKVNAKS